MREVPPVQRSLLDRAIEWASPSWGAERLAQRFAVELAYRTAQSTRVDRRRRLSSSPDAALEHDWDRRKMVDRGRVLERDNAIADGLLSRDTENVVGAAGIKPKSTSTNEGWREKVLERFNRWAKDEADVRGLSTFWDLQRLTYRSLQRDGDVGAIKLSDGALQCFESHQLVSPYGRGVSSRMVDGVELDPRGRPVAFHVVDPSSDRASVGRRLSTARVSAEDVIYSARRVRLNQTRGTPIFSGIARYFDQIDGYLEASIMAARMAACFGLVLHTKNRRKGLREENDVDGNPVRRMRLEPARILEVDRDDKVSGVTPAQPGTQFSDLVASYGRLLGIPFGVPLEVAFMDFSRTNYSSARAALLQAYTAWRCKQGHFVSSFLVPVWEWKVREWIESGELTGAPDDALAHEWVPPGWAWVDPMKEVEASLLAVDGGLDTLQDIALRMGAGDWSKMIERREAELAKIAELGVVVGRSGKTRDTAQPPVAEEPEDEGEGEGDESEDESEDDERGWSEEGVRRPITLTPPKGEAQPAPAAPNDDQGDEDVAEEDS